MRVDYGRPQKRNSEEGMRTSPALALGLALCAPGLAGNPIPPALPSEAPSKAIRNGGAPRVQRIPVVIGQDIRFTHLSIGEGLSHSRVNAITQDPYGFMWFGTEDGLDRYDGYRFVPYRHARDAPSSLSHSQIGALHADRTGIIWIGVGGGGGLASIDSTWRPTPSSTSSMIPGIPGV